LPPEREARVTVVVVAAPAVVVAPEASVVVVSPLMVELVSDAGTVLSVRSSQATVPRVTAKPRARTRARDILFTTHLPRDVWCKRIGVRVRSPSWENSPLKGPVRPCGGPLDATGGAERP
jgi:hypothetical protein